VYATVRAPVRTFCGNVGKISLSKNAPVLAPVRPPVRPRSRTWLQNGTKGKNFGQIIQKWTSACTSAPTGARTVADMSTKGKLKGRILIKFSKKCTSARTGARTVADMATKGKLKGTKVEECAHRRAHWVGHFVCSSL